MPQSPAPTPAATSAFQDRILTLLAPLFIEATGGDMAAARETVRSTLASYHARTDNEVRLAALVVAFGFGALDALSKAANRDLSLDEVMDLRDSATALSIAGDQNQSVLERLLKQRPAAPAGSPKPGELPSSTETGDLVSFARADLPAQAAFSSGQQREETEQDDPQQDFPMRHDSLGGGRTTVH
jgi:hypothetical protein